MPKIKYLAPEEVKQINTELGCKGMISEGNLSFVLDEIRDLHESLERKAIVLLYKLIQSHPFLDGNKRTAFLTMIEFLHRNGKDIKYSKMLDYLNRRLLYDIADNKIVLEDVENIFEEVIR
ncbi:MAG TPA: type II toxin-antitoxin system death-on-curing family toxin [Candidatus Saccharimonadales bacterium]|nr:type II toxin-antitoxin system death-on-curing family toxin [Candidatus Saccharimonadales bacterium]